MIDTDLTSCPCISKTKHISVPTSPASEFTLHHNAIPIPTERLGILSTLSQVQHDIAEVDDALAHLESAQKLLLSKREALKAFSDTHTGLLSSIRTMPAEILVEIFAYLKPRSLHPQDSAQAILLVTHICQQWRNIALSTPSLWDVIFANTYRALGGEALAAYAQASLSRARGAPLSINFQCSCNDTFNAVLDVILPSSHMWRHAKISLRPEINLSRIRNHLPLLEELHLLHIPDAEDEEGAFLDAFAIAPMLTCVRLSPSMGGFAGAIQLPWNQLTSFHSEFAFTIGRSIKVLQDLSNVVSLTMLVSKNAPDDDLDQTPHNHPLRLTKLENLKLTEVYGAPSLLSRLTLPSLKSLALCQAIVSAIHILDSLLSLIHRSSCSLTSLDLRTEPLDAQTSFEDLCRAIPKLEHLCLRMLGSNTEYWTHHAVIRSLSVPLPSGTVLPRLQTLKLEQADNSGPTQVGEFVNMVESRFRVSNETSESPVSCIKSVEYYNISNDWLFDSTVLERLEQCAEEGLHIHVYRHRIPFM